MEKSSFPENKRVTRIKKILELEHITQKDLADLLIDPRTGNSMEPQNFSRIMISGKVSEKTCEKIVAVYPKYRLEWLLGYDDTMTIDELKHQVIQRFNEVNKAAMTILDASVREVCTREGISPIPVIDNPAEYLFLEAQLRDFADSIVWNYIKHREHSHLWTLLDHDPSNPK